MKLYAYCLMDDAGALTDSLTGIANSKVRLLKIGRFSVLVSDFPGDTVQVNSENALAHAAVVRSVLTWTTPLPFRFGTVVTVQQLENYVTAKTETLQARLESVRGCVEMNVKVIWDQYAIEELQQETNEKPGTAFLAQKRREILGSEARVGEAKEVSSWLEERVDGLVKESITKTNPTQKLLLAAAHLVKRSAVEQYRSRLKDLVEENPDLHFLVSGPWPPYSFANIDLEFKSQFGVS